VTGSTGDRDKRHTYGNGVFGIQRPSDAPSSEIPPGRSHQILDESSGRKGPLYTFPARNCRKPLLLVSSAAGQRCFTSNVPNMETRFPAAHA